MPDIPHFAFPFRRDARGKVVVDEQDTSARNLSRANVIARCPIGARLARPDFGVPWFEYQTKVEPSDLADALARHDLEGLSAKEIVDLTAMANGAREIEAEVR